MKYCPYFKTRGGGEQVKFYLYKKGGRKIFSHAKGPGGGGGGQKVLTQDTKSSSHAEGGSKVNVSILSHKKKGRGVQKIVPCFEQVAHEVLDTWSFSPQLTLINNHALTKYSHKE